MSACYPYHCFISERFMLSAAHYGAYKEGTVLTFFSPSLWFGTLQQASAWARTIVNRLKLLCRTLDKPLTKMIDKHVDFVKHQHEHSMWDTRVWFCLILNWFKWRRSSFWVSGVNLWFSFKHWFCSLLSVFRPFPIVFLSFNCISSQHMYWNEQNLHTSISIVWQL